MTAMDDAEFFNHLEPELKSDFHSSPEEASAGPDDDSRTIGQSLDFDLGNHKSQRKISTSVSSIPSYQVLPVPEIKYSLENTFRFPDSVDFPVDSQSFPSSSNEERIPIRNEKNHDHLSKSPIFIPLVSDSSHIIYRVVDKEIPKDSDGDEVRYVGYSVDPEKRLGVCKAFALHLNLSDFPYSVEQRKTILRIDILIGILRCLPTQKEDGIFTRYRKQERKLLSEINRLMNLFACTDYKPVSPTMINRYVAAVIKELELLTSNDPAINLVISGRIPFFVDPAAYIITKLQEIFPGADDDKIEAVFFAERKDIHDKLALLFDQSKFPFTVPQRSLIIEVIRAVQNTHGNPDSKEEFRFQRILGNLLHDLNNIDRGIRIGISSTKKVRKEFIKFVKNLLELGKEEHRILSEFENTSSHPAKLVDYVINILNCDFIPRYTLKLLSSNSL